MSMTPRKLKLEPLEDRRMLATFTVANLLDGPVTAAGQLPGSLRQAIFDANATAAADEIVFSVLAGTISLTHGELRITNNLTIQGPAAGGMIIDASGSDPTSANDNGDGSRVFNIDDGTHTSRIVSIRNLTLTGGDVSGDGGAIRNAEQLALTNVVTRQNAATGYGGGIFSNVSLTLTTSTVNSNTATNRGGGVATTSGSLTITNSTLSGNSAFGGGGFHSQNTFTQVNGSNITGNTASTGGGGIRNYRGSLTVIDSKIDNNTGGYGGGIRNNQSQLTITGSTVNGNTGTLLNGNERGGGGIFQLWGNLTITNSQVSGNSSILKGGGIYASRGALKITASMLEGNYSHSHGGGIYSSETNFEIDETTLSGNTALGRGGGVIRVRENEWGPLVVLNSTISGNHSELNGGGILGSYQEITNSNIVGNSSIQNGGGLQGGPILLVDSIVDSNTTAGTGGGISSSKLTIVGSTVSRNVALAGGGGVFSPESTVTFESTLTIVDSTLSENVGYIRGGAINMKDGTATITGSTIKGNLAVATHPYNGYGGGIFGGGEFTITGSKIVDNLANTRGGGIYFGLYTLTIVDSLISGNEAGTDGGGIFRVDGQLSVTGTTFRNNSAQEDGGGLWTSGTFLTIGGSAFLDNHSGQRAGGIYASAYEATISMSTISGNFSETNGGGIYFYGANLAMTTSSITGNTSYGDGGGAFARVQSSLTVTSSTLGDNEAQGNGAGLYLWSRTPQVPLAIRHSTIARNKTDQAAGGMFIAAASTVDLSHTIVAQNQATLGPDLTGLIGVVFDAKSSLIGNNAQSGLAEAPVGAPDAKKNLIGGVTHGVIDALLAESSNNGGAGLTYELLVGSPAINAGNTGAVAGVGTVPLFDGRGGPFARIAGGRIDIGAYERQSFGQQALVVDTLTDVVDGNVSAGHLSLREAVGIANGNIGTLDTISFAPALVSAGPAVISFYRGEIQIIDSTIITGPGQDLLTLDVSSSDPTPEVKNGDGHRVFNIDDEKFTTSVEVTIAQLTLTGGDTQGKGGAILSSEILTVANSTITGNTSQEGGGGISHYGFRKQLNIVASTIAHNQARNGGGIYGIASSSAIIVEGSTIFDNHALSADPFDVMRGGGIFFHLSATGPAQFVINSSTISGNTAGGEGGGVYSGTDELFVYSSTIANNVAGGEGGGIGMQSTSQSVKLIHTIVAGNTSINEITDDIGARPFLYYSLIGNGDGSNVLQSTGSLVGTSLAPIDPRLGPLRDNGGPTLTHSLLSGSLALDAGDPLSQAGGYAGYYMAPVPFFDQRGTGFGRVVNGRIDMGAVEMQVAPVVGDFNGDGVITGRDFLAWQRNPNLGSLTDWQEYYGGALSALSASIEDEYGTYEDDQETSVSLIFGNSYTPPTADSSLLGGSPEANELFVESVDLAIEELSDVTQSGVREFGEMVIRHRTTRRPVKSMTWNKSRA